MSDCKRGRLDVSFECFKKEVLRRVNEFMEREGLLEFNEEELFEGCVGVLVEEDDDNKKFYEKRFFYVNEEYVDYSEYSVVDIIIKRIEDCGVKIVKGEEVFE